MKHVVILGASYGGIGTAHRILKQHAKTSPFKITLVSPNSHIFWNMAAARGVVPGKLTDDQLFQPIADGFKQYPSAQFEFILASAESLDVEGKKVIISSNQVLDYDYLVIATGTRSKELTPFKGRSSTEETKDLLHDFQGKIKNAKTIVVAGGGVTGCEVAGELAAEYATTGSKKIILVVSSVAVLYESPASVQKLATKELINLKVDLRPQTKVVGNVTKYIDRRAFRAYAFRRRQIGNGYYLDSNIFILMDEYLKMKGTKDVWAIGDVNNVEWAQFISCDKQSAYLAKNMVLILSNKPPLPYKPAGFMGLQIGPKAGTGHFGNYKVPSFIIVMARRNLFIDNMVPTVTGKLY